MFSVRSWLKSYWEPRGGQATEEGMVPSCSCRGRDSKIGLAWGPPKAGQLRTVLQSASPWPLPLGLLLLLFHWIQTFPSSLCSPCLFLLPLLCFSWVSTQDISFTFCSILALAFPKGKLTYADWQWLQWQSRILLRWNNGPQRRHKCLTELSLQSH